VRVAGTVRDFPTSGTESAATVVLGNGGAGDVSATTDVSGAYALTVPQGMYHVTINGESIADVTLRDPVWAISLGEDPLATTANGMVQCRSPFGCNGYGLMPTLSLRTIPATPKSLTVAAAM
jgi:hypothetical protein